MKLVKMYKFSVIRKTTNPERRLPSQLTDHKRRTRLGSIFLSWRRKRQPIPVFLPGESHGQRSLPASVHGISRVRHDLVPFLSHDSVGKGSLAMQETRVQYLDWDDPLEKEMATHSRFLDRRIPWTEEPGRLWSMGSQESNMTQSLNHHHQP